MLTLNNKSFFPGGFLMNLLKKLIPNNYVNFTNPVNSVAESFPFYIKEAGYINDHKFSRGHTNNYSDYLFLYSLTNMSFTKHGKKYAVSPHDIVVSACNTPLQFVQGHRKKNDYLFLIISGKHAQQFYNIIRTNDSIFRSNQYANILDTFLSLISIDYRTNPILGQMEASTLIHQLFLNLYKISLDILAAKKALPVQDTAINTAIKYIEKNYKNDLDIDTICTNVGFSKFYFCKMFKEHTGVTLHQYVTEYRINQAKNLLSYSKLSITAVANSVGYKNVLTFTRNFERLVKMTPSEYRQYY